LSITSIGVNWYRGFETDGDHLFLLADGTVAHNCQLPVVEGQWVFNAASWPRFAANTTKLTTNYRQASGPFLEALGAIRRGDGRTGADLLDACHVQYADNNDVDFAGTTIMATNDEVERFNWAAHSRLPGKATVSKSRRWGKQRGEWKLIPPDLNLKLGSYVMILANHKDNDGDNPGLVYANGDCGYVRGYHPVMQAYMVELKRNGVTVIVQPITRRYEEKERPSQMTALPGEKDVPYYDVERKKWVVGAVTYARCDWRMRVRLYKAQGMTLITSA
jgi:hypothetical protein